MKKVSLIIIAFFAFVSLVQAGNDKGKKVADASYAVDTQSSKLVWTGKKVTGAHTGNVSISGGNLVFANNKLKSGSFDIDLTTLTNTDLTDQSYNEKLIGHLKGEDFFSVAKFPKASFIITSVSPKGGENYEIAGKLTIKGITNEVKFPAVVKAEKNKATAQAKILVDRTKYDIKFRSKNFFENLGDKAIDNDFELDVNLVANQSGVSAKAGK
ncbi:Polyisoprenoid-binding protein YceI [Pseudarcicella hirudinis]|uniref:Polyisoprenoid-binding protein YceI n=1 Tax=Pseudarcicella hirudinis TaxID=1079859 RepID=A0A1I5RIN1_9BACT|nr:YceI family protein [Pseudarcicella hirudinis]SFP58459.1 Polyisoprenoid-binding protein YceI [Pseudarcicella hirudinis]